MNNTTEFKKWAEVDSNEPYYSANNAVFEGNEVPNVVLDYLSPEIK